MFPERSQKVSRFSRETGRERELTKIKFRCTVVYVRSGERVLLGRSKKRFQRDYSALQVGTLERGIPARYLVKLS
jgi:hypothetical protein